MKDRSTETPTRKAYTAPKLVVYGTVSELTQGGGRGREKVRHGRGGGGRGRGHGGSRS